MHEDPKINRPAATDRRRFLTTGAVAGAGLPLLANEAEAGSAGTCLELPPADTQVFNATRQYCMVQCGYKVYVWEQGKGTRPTGSYAGALSGEWISPSFVKAAEKNGKRVRIAAVPDKDCVVNHGDHSIRGGTNAQTLFAKNSPSAERRLLYPMIRKNGKGSPLERVSWDEATSFVAECLKSLAAAHGPDSLALV